MESLEEKNKIKDKEFFRLKKEQNYTAIKDTKVIKKLK